MQSKRLLFIFGTRPEAIKMAPVILAAQKDPFFTIEVCTTGQHREMLQQVMDFFGLKATYSLDLMQPNQTLFDITARAIKELERVLTEAKPDVVLVQGDTTTAFVGALAAFYKKINIGHIEAGLRSYDLYAPFPEEGNRKLTGVLANFHFAPTEKAVINLKKEGITEHVYQTGNTVIDALLMGVAKVRNDEAVAAAFHYLNVEKRIVLVTAHRRESFGQPLEEICQALLEIAERFHDVQVVYPVHLNPNVRETVYRLLGAHPRISLIAPLDYPHLLWLLDKSTLVITDSGGIQEEAPSLGKPVLVIREVTERQEGVDAGTALLVGTNQKNIVEAAAMLLSDESAYQRIAKAVNPYGTGQAATAILTLLRENL
ncbi:non-hydrolyzing UDP-N-acetylglucosamine 2-epimerase [Paracnuella aquatica]|uniref:non-hydrolyzing UDP-N-acetylglucosamine 2-epimerase n=2 Tax=Chitinophagaceae TaxID=563835 RepID=UPI000DEEBC30|nr:UDP-N-acetylglucosamine 2-epimerase (non-hydrolyzing) [Paracnuella aquatica]RPD51329.1 UDP-N-acetylglucosamine 2-epimerase (non-hydrolyzing) [Paracnuella aquatica]